MADRLKDSSIWRSGKLGRSEPGSEDERKWDPAACQPPGLFVFQSRCPDPIPRCKVHDGACASANSQSVQDSTSRPSASTNAIECCANHHARPPDRSYDPADLDRLLFIKQSQRLGFTLREIRQMVELHYRIARLPSNGANSKECRAMAAMTEEKLKVVDEKIELLRAMRRDLRGMLQQLRSQLPRCPVGMPLKSRK